MSGRDGIRGYTYQTIVSVMEALTNPDWEYVTIEPFTENEKVDIIWENKNGETTVQQVKSSENDFSRNTIIQILESLIKDKPDATHFETILVGHFGSKTNPFIKAINEGKADATNNVILNEQLGKIHIKKVPFLLDIMEGYVNDKVSKFLSNHGYHLPHPIIVLIARGLIYQFFQRSIIGTKTKRQDAIDELLNWAKYSYPRIFSEYNEEAVLSLKFYDCTTHEFIEEFKSIRFNFKHLNFISKQKAKILEIYNECKEISLLPRKVPEIEINSELSPAFYISKLTPLGEDEPADLYQEWKSFIIDEMYKYFNIHLDAPFFNVGNVMLQSLLFSLPFNRGLVYKGTEEEIKKRKLLNSLLFELNTLFEYFQFSTFLQEYFVVPLIIQNTGKKYDEEATVSITIPNYVELLTINTLYIPDNEDVLQLFIKNNFFEDNLLLKSDSYLDENNGFIFPRVEENQGLLESLALFQGQQEKVKRIKRIFQTDFERIFQYDVFDDIKNKITVKCEVRQIKPNQKIALPCLLLIKSMNTFKLQYTISTKQSSTIHKGELVYSIETQQ